MKKLLIAAGIVAVAKIGFSAYKKIKEGKKVDEAVVESVKDAVVAAIYKMGDVIDNMNNPRTKRTISEIMIGASLGIGLTGLLWFIESGNELKALKGEQL